MILFISAAFSAGYVMLGEDGYTPQEGDYYIFEVTGETETLTFEGQLRYEITEVADENYQVSQTSKNFENISWPGRGDTTYNIEDPGIGIDLEGVDYIGEETVDTGIGTFETIHYQYTGYGRGHGDTVINYFVTDDENKFPVKMVLESSISDEEPMEIHTLKETNIDTLKELAN